MLAASFTVYRSGYPVGGAGVAELSFHGWG